MGGSFGFVGILRRVTSQLHSALPTISRGSSVPITTPEAIGKTTNQLHEVGSIWNGESHCRRTVSSKRIGPAVFFPTDLFRKLGISPGFFSMTRYSKLYWNAPVKSVFVQVFRIAWKWHVEVTVMYTEARRHSPPLNLGLNSSLSEACGSYATAIQL